MGNVVWRIVDDKIPILRGPYPLSASFFRCFVVRMSHLLNLTAWRNWRVHILSFFIKPDFNKIFPLLPLGRICKGIEKPVNSVKAVKNNDAFPCPSYKLKRYMCVLHNLLLAKNKGFMTRIGNIHTMLSYDMAPDHKILYVSFVIYSTNSYQITPSISISYLS